MRAIASADCSPARPTSAIGGVGGALAQHAEATLERIGQERVPIVRELFRNLVTAQGTRADARSRRAAVGVRETGGPDRAQRPGSGREVLDALVDARLLTSYEPPAIEARCHRPPPHRDRARVAADVVAAPGAMADAGSGRRAAARSAASGGAAVGRARQARGPPVDRHVVSRVRALARALCGHAVGERRHVRPRHDRAHAAPPAAAAARRRPPSPLPRSPWRCAMGVLWRQSEGARAEAVTAARRAEAQQLFTLGQAEIDRNPTAARGLRAGEPGAGRQPRTRGVSPCARLWQGPPRSSSLGPTASWGVHACRSRTTVSGWRG